MMAVDQGQEQDGDWVQKNSCSHVCYIVYRCSGVPALSQVRVELGQKRDIKEESQKPCARRFLQLNDGRRKARASMLI